MSREDQLVRLEVMCGVMWLLSDGSWLMQWQIINLVTGVSAIILAVAIFFYQEWKPVPILVCCAGTSWLLMNVLWAVGDLADPKIESFALAARIFFFVAITCMAAAFWMSKGRGISDLVLRRVRILRNLRS